MRLWHYKMIPVLPNKMLVSQWRECIAIKRQWEKGTLKHRLVSYVIDYNKAPFYQYVAEIRAEMYKRNIKYNDKYFQEIIKFTFNDLYNILDMPYYPEHNDRYLKQCYYNLQEKADRGIITKEEWKEIEDRFKNECGHSIFIPHYVSKTYCTWCHRTVYRNEQEEFKDKLQKQLAKK